MATMLIGVEIMLMTMVIGDAGDNGGVNGDDNDGSNVDNGDDGDHNLVSQQEMMELSW